MNKIHERAGARALASDLINCDALLNAYENIKPNAAILSQSVIFGTSGHRGSASQGSFNQNHLLAIAQAIVDIRKKQGITGPCFIGKDTHLLSKPALETVIEVFTANHINIIIAEKSGFTPTPVISHAIIRHNRHRSSHFADGVVLTPSHNPPEDGGIKYNPSHGGPAETVITKAIESRANELLRNDLKGVKRIPLKKAFGSGFISEVHYEKAYIDDLINVIDMKTIAGTNLTLAVDPLGGAGITYWPAIAEKYKLNLTMVNEKIDPTFAFMHLDHDGVIRMDCSSQYAMGGLIKLKNRYDLAFGNDTDFDRHGIVTPNGLMLSNDYLATVANYLLSNRDGWKQDKAIGKTVVTTALLDKIATAKGRRYYDYPVGFKWYSPGLSQGQLGFACEESAGGTFLRHNGDVWTTDKDGIILCLLAAEMTAKTNRNPSDHYKELTNEFGCSHYGRVQASASLSEKDKLAKLVAEQLTTTMLAGEKIKQCLINAPANNAPINGLKVITENGWFVARPSGTENAYKIYAESFVSEAHLNQLKKEAQTVVSSIIN